MGGGSASVFLLPKIRFFGYWIEEGQIKKLVWLWGKGCMYIKDCLKPIFALSLTWLLDLIPNIHGQFRPSNVNNQVMPMYIATFAYIYTEVTTLLITLCEDSFENMFTITWIPVTNWGVCNTHVKLQKAYLACFQYKKGWFHRHWKFFKMIGFFNPVCTMCWSCLLTFLCCDW